MITAQLSIITRYALSCLQPCRVLPKGFDVWMVHSCWQGNSAREKRSTQSRTFFVCAHVRVLLLSLLWHLLEEGNCHLTLVLHTVLTRKGRLLQYLAQDWCQLWMLQLYEGSGSANACASADEKHLKLVT